MMFEQWVKDVQRHAPFMPLAFAASGGMGKAATVFCKWLASLLVSRR